MNTKITNLIRYAALTGLLTFTANLQAEPDWSSIDSQTVTTFWPGVSSWQFLVAEDHGTGVKPVVKNKKSCAKCHVSKKGEFDIAADELVSGELTMSVTEARFEPAPKEGLDGYMDIQVQAAYDDNNVYLKVTWPSAGTSFNDAAVADNGMADRVSIQMATKKVKTFKNFGCYIACHDDMVDMPKDAGRKLYAEFSMKKGKALPQKMLDTFKSKGMIIDQWIAAFHGNEVKASDEYIISDREADNADVMTTGTYADGNYSVVFTRPLVTTDEGDVQLKDGDTVSISIAIHEKNSNSRFHYTSFPVSVGLGGKKADIVASKL